MNTEKSLYLALKNLFDALIDDGIAWPAHSPMVPATIDAKRAMKQFEGALGPLPDWATAHNIAQEPVLYAQLFTRNPRHCGNAMIFHVVGKHFGVITDMGCDMTLNAIELDQLFEIGDYIFDEHAYLKRKRQRDDYIDLTEVVGLDGDY